MVISDKKRDYELEAKAKLFWREYCKKPKEVDYAFDRFNEAFPGVVPEAFECSGNYRTRKAYEQLKGKVGRLRAYVGEPLELRRINFTEIPELESLNADIFAQFESGLIRIAFDALTGYVNGPVWSVIEKGRVNLENHFHVLIKPGSCKIGVNCGVIRDADLLEKLAYLCKTPEWQLENVVGYLSVKQAYPSKPVARRYSCRGIGSFAVDLVTLEAILGFSLSKPKDAQVQEKKREAEHRVHYVFGSPPTFVSS